MTALENMLSYMRAVRDILDQQDEQSAAFLRAKEANGHTLVRIKTDSESGWVLSEEDNWWVFNLRTTVPMGYGKGKSELDEFWESQIFPLYDAEEEFIPGNEDFLKRIDELPILTNLPEDIRGMLTDFVFETHDKSRTWLEEVLG